MNDMVDNLESPFSLRHALQGDSGTSLTDGTLCSLPLIGFPKPLVAGLYVRGLDRDDALAMNSNWCLFE